MVFDGRFKLCRYHNFAGELYDLERDPMEYKNLWDNSAYRDQKLRLLVEMTDRMAQTVDTLPERLAKW
jgi:hypothetical protein